MKVSVAWIAVGIIIVIVLYFTVEGFSIYEQFTNQVEGFADAEEIDIKITTCPADTASYIDSGGRTVCCEGTVDNGKCSGKNVCSLSEAIDGLPTCSAWLDAYLENKGNKRCPPSMPKYYETKGATQAGCTAGNRNAQGTAPAANTNKFCTLYRSEQDSMLKLDSCENQKILEEAKCLSKPTTRVLNDWNGVIPPPVNCSGIDTGSLTPISCLDDAAFIRAADYWAKVYPPYMKNWKEQSINWGAQWKMNFCSVVQKVTIDKSMSMRDLESYQVFK
jgi:hypothetical protein